MTTPDRNVWQTAEWKSGWLMGIGVGVLVCVIVAQLPDAAFERWTMLFVMAAVATFAWGVMCYKTALRKPTEQRAGETDD